MYIRFTKLFLLFFLPIALFYACGDDDDVRIKVVEEDSDGESESVDASAYVRCIEVPALSESDGVFVVHEAAYGSHKVMNYCLEFAPSAMHSRWVAFRFDGVTRQQTTGRSDEPFTDDPLLASQYWIGSNYFPGYDRGHLCASADRVWSSEANVQTFYMSNMSPQIRDFNSGIWADFEIKLRTKGRDATFADTVYVAKGGTIRSDQIIGSVVRNNSRKVSVPKYYFMAFLRCKYGSYDAIGVWLEHRTYSKEERANLKNYLVSIDQLEQETGIDFFANLPDNVETAVEASYNPTLWGF